MLTITKWSQRQLFAVTATALWLLTGCTPAGPRALLEGEAALRMGQTQLALNKLRVATDLIPQEPRAWNYLGLAYQHAGQSDAALRAYQQALSRDRWFKAARFNLGCLYSELGNWPAAIQELNLFLQAEPRAPHGWLQLGLAQLRARQFTAAEPSLSQALQLDASLAEAWNGLGLIRCQKNNYRDATNYFTAALRYDAHLSSALLNHAVVLHQHFRNRPLALQKYREYLAVAPATEQRAQVQLLAAQLDQELNPAPRVVTSPTNMFPLTTVKVTQTVHLASQQPAVSNPPPTLAAKPPPTLGTIAEPQPRTEPATQTASPPLGPAAPRVRSETNLPSLAAQPTTNIIPAQPLPIPKTEVQAMTPLPTAPRKDDLSSAPPVQTAQAKPPIPAATKSSPPDKPQASVARPTQSRSASVLASRTDLPRYPYQNLLFLPSGNRDQAENFHRQAADEQKAGRISAAIDLYRKAVQTDPSYYEAYRDLGAQAVLAGDLPVALFAFERALLAHPAAVSTRFSFAQVLERANYMVDAALELEKVIHASPADSRPELILANLYAQQLQQPLLAREHYQRVLEIDPQHPQAAAIRQWLAVSQ
jgi:tetratricopeptide (TPR) repeat protein